MKGRLGGRDPDHGVSAALPGGPAQLHHVQSPLVTDPRTDAVGALCHRVPVEREFVVLLHEDVERPVLRVPGVLDLSFL